MVSLGFLHKFPELSNKEEDHGKVGMFIILNTYKTFIDKNPNFNNKVYQSRIEQIFTLYSRGDTCISSFLGQNVLVKL